MQGVVKIDADLAAIRYCHQGVSAMRRHDADPHVVGKHELFVVIDFDDAEA